MLVNVRLLIGANKSLVSAAMQNAELFPSEKIEVKGRKKTVFDRSAKAAQRRATAKWVDLMLAQGVKPPLVILAEIYSEDVTHLAQRLECKPIEAERLRVHCAERAAQYWHDKPGNTVELPDGRTAVFMPMVLNGAAAAYDGGELRAVEPPSDIAEKLEASRLISEIAPKSSKNNDD